MYLLHSTYKEILMRIILLGVVGISDGRGNFIMDLVGELNLNILNDESCTC